MPIRAYILATEQVANDNQARYGGPATFPKPKYTSAFPRSFKLFPNENWCVCLVDATNGQHNAINANADAHRFPAPANLDDEIGASGAAFVSNGLTVAGLPNYWVDETDTYRDVLEALFGLALFSDRFSGKHRGRINADTWNKTWSELSQPIRDRLIAASNSFKTPLDRSDFTASTTLDVIYVSLAKRYMAQRDRPFTALGIEIFPARR